MFKFCPNCGTKNEGWKICPECGTPLERTQTESTGEVSESVEGLDALARAAVVEKQRQMEREEREEALNQVKKMLSVFEYDEHADGTFTVTKLKDRSAPVVTVPEKVVGIADGTFEGCDRLRRVILPEGLMDIGANAFKGCVRLIEVTLPKSLLAIDAGAFQGCNSLTEVLLPQGADPSIDETAFDETCVCGHSREEIDKIRADRKQREEEEEKKRKEFCAECDIEGGVLLKYNGNREIVEIPQGVIFAIGSYAFDHSSNLKQITIPEGVTEIRDAAFSCAYGGCGCHDLELITIPNGVRVIGSDAFRSCSNLKQIMIPNSVTTIGHWAFWSCGSLTICCQAPSKPSGWDDEWNPQNRPVEWGCK